MIPNSFAGRLLILMVALLGAALLASTWASLRAANATVSTLAEDELEVLERVTRFSFDQQSQALRERVELVTADFAFKQAMATGETDTLLSALANHGERLEADLALLLARDGELRLASVPLQQPTDALQRRLSEVTTRATTLLDIIDGAVYRLVLSPVLAPDLIGWLVLGEQLDQDVLADLKRLTGADVTLLLPAADTVMAQNVSTLPTALVSEATDTDGFIAGLQQKGWLSRPVRLGEDEQNIQAVLSLNLDRALASYDPLRFQLVLIGAFALVLAALLSLIAARWITRPVRAMVQSAQRISEGNYAAEIGSGGGTELDHLSEALGFMQSTVAERESRIQHQARHDMLTQLPNRNYLVTLYERYRQQQPGQAAFAIALLELENLQQLRDLYGGAFADETLRTAASRVAGNLREGDMAARVGDQQILIFARDVTAEHVQDLMLTIREHSDQPLFINGVPVQSELRLGFAFSPAHGSDLEDLQRRAQLALSAARLQGSEQSIYQLGQDEKHLRQIRIASRLQGAVERQEFNLLYQPKYSIKHSRVTSAEALLRWQDEELGPVYPDEFIPIAEQTGAITRLSEWVVGQVTKDLSEWHQSGRDLSVSVNLSGVDVLQADFLDSVLASVRDARLPTNSLTLEVTETAMMSDVNAARANLNRLSEAGMRISIDDYGTGFSSLSQLRSLPVNELKIDRSLVMDIDTQEGDRLIVCSTIEMAHHLGLEVVAEGVESPQIFRALREMGCDVIQGYLLSKPLPVAQFLGLLDEPGGNVASLLRALDTNEAA